MFIILSKGKTFRLTYLTNAQFNMRIFRQHFEIFMAANACHFANGQALLKESADTLMSQIMETEILNSCPFDKAWPGQPNGRIGRFEYIICFLVAIL